MKVRIESEIHVEADTIEEAVASLEARLRAQIAKVQDRGLVEEYHRWNEENDCDVDWIPHNTLSANSTSIIHVVNIRGRS